MSATASVATSKYKRYHRGEEISLRRLPEESRIFHCKQVIKDSNNNLAAGKARILLLTKCQVIELLPNSSFWSTDISTILQVHELASLFKINYKKATSSILRIQFKNDAILCYIMNDAMTCVDFLKYQMSELGIEGSITKAKSNVKTIESAQAFYEQTMLLESEFTENPNVELIRQVMDLMREATERFSEANDDRYEAVIQQIKIFLQKPEVEELLQQVALSDGNSNHDSKNVDVNSYSTANNTVTAATAAVTAATTAASTAASTIMQYADSAVEEITSFKDKLQKMALSGSIDSNDDDGAVGVLVKDDCPTINNDSNINSKNVDDNLEEELNDMLGDMTKEFNHLLKSFSSNTTDGLLNIGDVDVDDDDALDQWNSEGGAADDAFNFKEFEKLMSEHEIESSSM